MKIVLLANNTTHVYNSRVALLQQILSAGHQVIIVSQFRTFQSELMSMGCDLINVNINRRHKNPLQDVRLLLRYLSILRQE